MDYSPSGSSVHEISQARILEWIAISFPRGSSWPRDWIRISCTAVGFFTTEPHGNLYIYIYSVQFSSVQFIRSVMSNLLQPHELQHARPPCPSPTPRVQSNPCPLSRWCHPTISSSVVLFPPAFNLSQHQGLFQWVSSSYQVAKVLEFQLQHQSFQWTPRTIAKKSLRSNERTAMLLFDNEYSNVLQTLKDEKYFLIYNLNIFGFIWGQLPPALPWGRWRSGTTTHNPPLVIYIC